MKNRLHMAQLTTRTVLALMGFAGAAGATNITKEHLDVFDVDYSAGVLSLDYKTYTNMSPGVPLNNDDYSPVGNPVIVPIANTYTVPSGGQWACLGAAGTTVYRLKQNFVANELWAGWNAQDVPTGVFVNNRVQVELVSVISAPAGGRMVIYTTNSFGTPSYQLNTASGSCNDTVLDISANAHLHGWWAFSKAGSYTFRFRAKGTLSAGGTATSTTVDYTFLVQ